MNQQIHGWGAYPKIISEVLMPRSLSACKDNLNQPLIARGMGRSYGDSANAPVVMQTNALDRYIEFDTERGLLTCEAGVTLRDILTLIVPRGWFLPVTPGTSYVTVGGAIASDVHGKNHHIAGTFCQHVESMALLLGSGDIVTLSPTHLPELFYATCAGMGLTGIILVATIKLMRISSSNIIQKTIKATCIEDLCYQCEAHQQSTYSVAWIDCVTNGQRLGRSVLMLGEHADDKQLALNLKEPLSLPVYAPATWLNKYTVSLFNCFYYARATHNLTQNVAMFPYFYPLDSIGQWNKLYGKAGFVQYQFVLPKEYGVENMRAILKKIADSGLGSFLAVLKQFGPQNLNLLSFPLLGYTLALDFKISANTIKLLNEIDAMVISMGGRIYLSKDALMSELTFKASYPQWQRFEAIRDSYQAIGKFASAQSKRLGLQ